LVIALALVIISMLHPLHELQVSIGALDLRLPSKKAGHVPLTFL
jgi:hypothetical protein